MSRLKIGSVTVAVGENGTRLTQSRTVSHAADTEPPMTSARRPRRHRGPSRPAASGRAGRGASKTTACAAGDADRDRPRPRSAEPVAPRRSSAAWAASLRRSNSARSDAAIARWRRGQPAGEPQVAEEDDEGEEERRERRGRVASSRVQNTESNPTLPYHRASVQRSSPTLNSRKSAMAMTTKAAIPNRRPARAARLPATVVRATGSVRRRARRRRLVGAARR